MLIWCLNFLLTFIVISGKKDIKGDTVFKKTRRKEVRVRGGKKRTFGFFEVLGMVKLFNKEV